MLNFLLKDRRMILINRPFCESGSETFISKLIELTNHNSSYLFYRKCAK